MAPVLRELGVSLYISLPFTVNCVWLGEEVPKFKRDIKEQCMLCRRD